MKNSAAFRLVFLLSVLLFLSLMPQPCLAFQEHGATEGLFAHQLAHICFGSSMLWLFFMIKKSIYWKKKCWKAIALGAIILVFWNIMTFIGHILAPRSQYLCDITIPANRGIGFWIWYLTKFDTLVSCLSMTCFFLGLRTLNRSIKTAGGKENHNKGPLK